MAESCENLEGILPDWVNKDVEKRLAEAVIGQQNSRHFFSQQTKPLATCTRAFSRPLHWFHVIASYSDWLIALFRSVVIG